MRKRVILEIVDLREVMVTKRTSFLPIQRYHKQKFKDTSFLHLKMAVTKRLSNKTKQLYASLLSVKIAIFFIKILSSVS